jgi:hypothetical protein
MPINAEACLSLPVNQSVDYAKQDTHIAQACALGGSTKLSEGGFVLVSVEVRTACGNFEQRGSGSARIRRVLEMKRKRPR